MSQNTIQFQKGMSLAEFMRDYATEAQCVAALFKVRWPGGFLCPECGGRRYSLVASRQLYQCRRCRHQESLRAHTLLQASKLPLTTWFLAMYLLSQSKNGLAALALKRQLGVSYKTAWALKHKLMQAMREREASRRLSGRVEVDDAYLGGRHPGKRGRGAAHKQPFVAAVSTDTEGHPRRLVLSVVKGFRRRELESWGQAHLTADSRVVSDGLDCFRALAAQGHPHETARGGPEGVRNPIFKWVNTLLGNIKTALAGTYHAQRSRYAARYLAEFQYRFNRRINLSRLFKRLLYTVAQTPPLPGRLMRFG